MIVMNLELDNIYGFNDFAINFSYPKRIVNSSILCEHLKECPKFRYRKAVVLLGANATGKTTLGLALLRIFDFIETGNLVKLTQMVADRGRPARISIDLINRDRILHRIIIELDSSNAEDHPYVNLSYESAFIKENDTYEKVVQKLTRIDIDTSVSRSLVSKIGRLNYSFALDNEANNHRAASLDPGLFLRVLKAIIGTLDPTLSDISAIDNVENSYVIRRKGQEIILQNGRLSRPELLSSGTIRGIEISILMSMILSGRYGFYYCDEHFSYIQTDIEKRLFGLMLENLHDDEQLVFTTHNSDMLDLNLPKHSYAFLGRRREAEDLRISVIYASDVLKRNTDSVRCAAANDMFFSIPDESLLDSLSGIS